MPSVRFQKVRSEDRLMEFHRKFCNHIEYQVPLEYFEKGSCYALIVNGEIVAGFCLVYRPANELRSLQQVPYFCHTLYKDEFVYRVAEFTGYFIDKKSYAFKFTMNLVRIVLLSPAHYFVYSYPVDQKRLGKYYAKGKPIRIYSGKPRRLEGHPEGLDEERVEVLTKWGIVRIFLHRTRKYLRLF